MDNTLNFTVISATIIALVIAIYNKAIKNGQFTCDSFVLNTYLYITLAIMLITAFIMYFGKLPIEQFKNKFIFVFILSLISLIGINFFSKNLFISHLLWLIFLMCISYTLVPFINLLNRDKILIKTLISTFMTLFLLTMFAYIYPEYIDLNIHSTLVVLLFSGIIVQLVNAIFPSQYSDNLRLMMSYGFIVLFSFFILYDTKILKIKAQQCINKLINPNYPKESMDIFLDILNLFTNFGEIYKK